VRRKRKRRRWAKRARIEPSDDGKIFAIREIYPYLRIRSRIFRSCSLIFTLNYAIRIVLFDNSPRIELTGRL